jgi:hypothetical protein
MTQLSQDSNETLSDKDSETLSTTPLTKPKGVVKWQPGVSGNPLGRPRGSKNRITQAKLGIEEALRGQLHEYMPEVLTKAIEMALKGDRAMIKLLMELTISKAQAMEDNTEGREKVQITIRKLDSLNVEQSNIIDVIPETNNDE